MSFKMIGLCRTCIPSFNLNTKLLKPKRLEIQKIIKRSSRGLIPADQYSMPFPKKFKLSYALVVYWELIPTVLVVVASFALVFGAVLWAIKNKVDLVVSPGSRNNISRTMDLNNPTVHKFMIINQRYPPWPEMAKALSRMKCAEDKQFGTVLHTVCDLK